MIFEAVQIFTQNFICRKLSQMSSTMSERIHPPDYVNPAAILIAVSRKKTTERTRLIRK